ncbi:uncharacterized protein HaLaN_16472 [Haematococcus lacustris]|uniref:Uncharacterized protein n=1 Tax=Haematococcus lacustris TaxID=44745 RepID=A0A699ZCM7_HAELA|nr:uncharacterized protein HaLaN_16472 [Haematococcus lacustris]
METTFGENEQEEEEGSELDRRRAALVPACDFQQHVDSAKQELAATADAVVRDLHSRFLPPEHAKGLAVVQEERMFSAMAYLKDDTRNRLQECHLNVCARVFSSNQFDLDTFLDERAVSKWLDNVAVRGRYRL